MSGVSRARVPCTASSDRSCAQLVRALLSLSLRVAVVRMGGNAADRLTQKSDTVAIRRRSHIRSVSTAIVKVCPALISSLRVLTLLVNAWFSRADECRLSVVPRRVLVA